MGFWNDGIRTRQRSRSRSRSSSSASRDRRSSHHRTPSRTHSHSSSRHYTSRPSFARSASSFFSLGGGSQSGGPRAGSTSGSTSRGRSYTSARPRSGFVARVRRFLRQVYDYMRRHPVKTFMLVIMPLITGGVLTKLLATVGVRMPRSVEQMMGSSMNRGASESQRYYARGGARDYSGGSALPGMGGGGMGLGEGVQTALNIAKMFM